LPAKTLAAGGGIFTMRISVKGRNAICAKIDSLFVFMIEAIPISDQKSVR